MASPNPISKAVWLDVQPSGVAVITINLPDSPLNVLSRAVMSEFDEALNRVKNNLDIKGLIVTSGKQGSFVAGADINEIAALQSDRSAIRQAVIDGKNVLQKLEDLRDEMRVVAAVDGVALGGGFELILACTHRVATDKSEFGLPEGTLGVLPGFGGCIRLPNLIGAPNAMPVILKARQRFEAKKAWRQGMVDEVVKGDKLLERAEQIALGKEPKRAKQSFGARFQRWFVHSTPIGRLQFQKQVTAGLTKEAGKNYPAPWAAFKAVNAAMTKPTDEAMEVETELFADMAITDVSHNLVGMYFAIQDSKKTPGNARPNIKPSVVGIAGAGVMGASIAQVALYAGYPVTLYDKFPEGLKKGADKIVSLFDYLVKKRKITREEQMGYLSNLSLTTDIAGLKQCNLVIEAIIEDMGKKKEFLATLEAANNGKPFIFASNTSSLSIAEMSADMKFPGNAGGLHFFNPAEKLPLVEVVAGDKTSRETVASLMHFVSRLSGKYSVVTKDRPGFVVNRILVPYAYEAIKLLEMGVPPEEIEQAMLDFGMAMGPLHVLDEVGLDVGGKVVHILNKALGERLAPPNLLNWIEGQKGLLGKKSGKGLYIWEDGKAKGFNPDVLAAIPAQGQPLPMPREQIEERLVMVMINEASRVLEEGIVESASQVDLSMIMGCGFPPYRGGILRYADKLGAAKIVETLMALQATAGDNYKPSATLLDTAKTGRKFYA